MPEIERDLGRLEAKTDAILSALSEIKTENHALHSRVTTVEKRLDEVKYTVRGVLLAGSLIGSVVSSGGILVWKWITGAA